MVVHSAAFHTRVIVWINSTVKGESRCRRSSYLLLAVSAEQDDEDQQQDQAQAHNEQGEVRHECHN